MLPWRFCQTFGWQKALILSRLLSLPVSSPSVPSILPFSWFLQQLDLFRSLAFFARCPNFNYFQHILISPTSDKALIKGTSLSSGSFRTQPAYRIPEALGQATPENVAKTSFCSEQNFEGHPIAALGPRVSTDLKCQCCKKS